jgi:hypothetical protein
VEALLAFAAALLALRLLFSGDAHAKRACRWASRTPRPRAGERLGVLSTPLVPLP